MSGASSARDNGPVRSAARLRIAITAVFVVHGVLFASWTAHIPHVKKALGLSDGTLGFALLGAPIGSVAATIAAGWLLPRLGSRRMVQLALVGYCAAGPLVGLTGSLAALFGALTLWGAFQGGLDVSMNTQGIAAERHTGRVIMSGLHAGWSIGAFLGAGIGAVAVSLGVGLTPQLLVLGSVAVLIGGWLTTWLLPDQTAVRPPDAAAGTQRSARWSRGTLALGAIAFASMLCEGATADWAAVYLSGRLHTSGVVPGLGYATFSLAMVVVRLSGNRLLTRFGAGQVLPVLAAVATIGFGSALIIGQPVAAIIGFGCLGAGLGSVVPAAFSAAGRIPGLHPGVGVATVSGCGWTGFVFGPVIIGHLADLTSLPVALGLLPVLTAFITLATRRVRAIETPAR